MYDEAIENLRKEADAWEALAKENAALSLDTGAYYSRYTQQMYDSLGKISGARKYEMGLIKKKKSLDREISLSVQLPRFKTPHRAVLNKGRFVKIYKDAKCVAEGEIPSMEFASLFEFSPYASQRQAWVCVPVGKQSISLRLTSSLNSDEIEVCAAAVQGSVSTGQAFEYKFQKTAVNADPAT